MFYSISNYNFVTHVPQNVLLSKIDIKASKRAVVFVVLLALRSRFELEWPPNKTGAH